MSSVYGALIEYEDDQQEIYTNSGLLFKDKFVLITGNVLIPYLKSNKTDLYKWLLNIQPGKINFSPFPSTYKKPQLKVIFNKADGQIKFKRTDVFAAFVCKNILRSCQRYLPEWAIDFDDKEYQAKQLLSLFFILRIADNTNLNESDLYVALKELLQNANRWQIEIGKEIFMESTPFGNRSFLNSYSQGVISNVTGEDSCFLLTDCPSAPGSEGSPVFIKLKSKFRYPIAIGISCLNWWKGEWVGLILCANLVPLLLQIVPLEADVDIKHLKDAVRQLNRNLLSACSNSLVQIVSGTGWGTGILLNKEKGIFLTNSHVIENDKNVIVYWKDIQLNAKVLYKTPNSEVFDVAILQAQVHAIPHFEMSQVQISLQPAIIGEEVVAAGFPLFPRYLKPKVTITKGYVSQTRKSIVKTTCAVIAGSSGGAIFRPNGELLALIVSNVKMDEINVVYPRINMSIPILEIYDVIQEFLATGDIEVLKRLHSNDTEVCKQWNFVSAKL